MIEDEGSACGCSQSLLDAGSAITKARQTEKTEEVSYRGTNVHGSFTDADEGRSNLAVITTQEARASIKSKTNYSRYSFVHKV